LRAAIQRNGGHLLGLINGVLDLSKIEAGQFVLSLADYSLKNVVEAVYTAVEQLAKEKRRYATNQPKLETISAQRQFKVRSA
jgi:signal transduction histidine kinase